MQGGQEREGKKYGKHDDWIDYISCLNVNLHAIRRNYMTVARCRIMTAKIQKQRSIHGIKHSITAELYMCICIYLYV